MHRDLVPFYQRCARLQMYRRIVAAAVRKPDRRFAFRCGPADWAHLGQQHLPHLQHLQHVQQVQHSPHLSSELRRLVDPTHGSLWKGADVRDRLGLCTCGAVSSLQPPPHTFAECLAHPQWSYGKRHVAPRPPAPWRVLRRERNLALELTRSALELDSSLLSREFISRRCDWVPLFIYLPPGSLLPTTALGLRNLATVLLESDYGCRDYECPGDSRAAFIAGLASPTIAEFLTNEFYSELLPPDRHIEDQVFRDSLDDGQEAEADGAGMRHNKAGRESTTPPAATLNVLEALDHLISRSANPSEETEQLLNRYDELALWALDRSDRSGWLHARAWPRVHTATWAHICRGYLGDRDAFIENGRSFRTRREDVPPMYQQEASSVAIAAHFAANIKHIDAVHAHFQRKCSLSVINIGGTILDPRGVWIVGLSRAGHLVGCISTSG